LWWVLLSRDVRSFSNLDGEKADFWGKQATFSLETHHGRCSEQGNDGRDNLVMVVQNLTPIHQKDCKKLISLMETWMVSNGMIKKRKSGATTT
jgi:hypothetical protein